MYVEALMFFFDKDGNPVYLYRFSTYEQEFWMASTKKYTEEELRAVIDPIEKQYDRDYNLYREKCNEIFAKKESGEITEEEWDQAQDELDDLPPWGVEYGLKQVLADKLDMVELKPDVETNAHWGIW